MMKAIILLFICVLSVNLYSQENKLTWLKDLEAAQKLSEKEKKPILVYFTGSDWCPPCKKLKKDFWESEKFTDMADSFVLLYIDMPRNKKIIEAEQYNYNITLLEKFNKKGVFPKVVALDHKENILGNLEGYDMRGTASKHFSFLETVLNNNYQ